MRTETNQSWLRQLGAISQGMLFLDGHIATAAAAEAMRKATDTDTDRPEIESPTRSAAKQAEYVKQVQQMTALSLFR